MKNLKQIITAIFLMLTSSIAMAQTGTWVPLSNGTNSIVYSMATSGNDVYIAGSFSLAGGINARGVAKWDGTNWSPLGTGVSTTVSAVAVNGNDVYVGGAFTQAGGVPVSFIAKWDGTSWSALGTGTNFPVETLMFVGNDLYVGGQFTEAGGIPANGIAKWDGTNWSALGEGVTGGGSTRVTELASIGNDIYAGGIFLLAGGDTARNIAKWDGTSWSALGAGFNNYVLSLAVNGNDVYAGGIFTQSGATPLNYIAKWDGTSWTPLGTGLSGVPVAIVFSLAVHGSDVYAGGRISSAGGNPVNNIAKWDGTSWSALGSGVNNFVYSLAYLNNNIFAGGSFTQAGGNNAGYIAQYEMVPPAPSDLSLSIPSPGAVQLNWTDTLSNEDGFVIERSINSDSSWSLLDTADMNTTSYLDSGLTTGNRYYYRMYAANQAGISGYSDTVNILMLLPPSPPNNLSLNVLDTGVVKLTWADSSNNEEGFVLERRDNVDTNWTVRDTTGTDTVMYTDAGLIVGRTYYYRVYAYNEGGNSGYSNVASTLITGVPENSSLPDKYALYNNYPNPFNPTTKIKFDIPKSGIVKLTVYDILGREVSRLVNGDLTAGRYEMEWNAGGFASGMYFYRLETDGFVEVKKMMLIK